MAIYSDPSQCIQGDLQGRIQTRQIRDEFHWPGGAESVRIDLIHATTRSVYMIVALQHLDKFTEVADSTCPTLFLQKPFTTMELNHRVKELLELTAE
jgi:hypothetical protein